jgi:hypothetical protein
LQETAYPLRLRRGQGLPRQFHVRGTEARTAVTAFVQDADQVDHCVLSREHALQGGRVVGAALDQLDLRVHAEVPVPVRPARQDPHLNVAVDQVLNNVVAYKAGAAQQADLANRIDGHDARVLPKANAARLIRG